MENERQAEPGLGHKSSFYPTHRNKQVPYLNPGNCPTISAVPVEAVGFETMSTQKKVAVIPFPGGRVEVRNAFEYPDKETGAMRQARAGTFLCVPGAYPLDVTGVDFEALGRDLKKNKLAQQIIAENNQG